MTTSNINQVIQGITGYLPSGYQQKVLNFLVKERGNASINAVAGAGKSSTLLQCCIALKEMGVDPSQVRVSVFGKANALDLETKLVVLGEEWRQCASTLHSLGFSILKETNKGSKFKVNNYKYRNIAQELGLVYNFFSKEKGSLTLDSAANEYDFLKLLDLVRLHNEKCTPELVKELSKHYTLDIQEHSIVSEAIIECLDMGKAMFKMKKELDFCDMIWLPVVFGKTSTKYQYFFIDECQDLSSIQRDLVSLLGTGGRVFGVGDKNQAVFGFCGSSNEGMDDFSKQFNTTQLLLSTCYRCPQDHIAFVNTLFPDIPIKSAKGAERGSVTEIRPYELSDHLQKGDLILCRLTAPLISKCIDLISEGINAKVKGRDIGQMINKELDVISKIEGFEFSRLSEFCSFYIEEKTKKYENRNNAEDLVVAVQQRVDCILAIFDMQASLKSVADFKKYTTSLFTEDEVPVLLSTIHKAKGLEADRVFIIEPTKLPLVWKNQQSWERQQENNLTYVAFTRGKQELFIVGKSIYSDTIKKLKGELEPKRQEKEKVSYTNFSLLPKHKATKNPKWFLWLDKVKQEDLSFSSLLEYQSWRDENKHLIGSESHIYSFDLSETSKVWLANGKNKIPKRNRTKG